MLNEGGGIVPFNDIKRKFRIHGTALDYQGLIESLPLEWKRGERNKKEPDPIIHPSIQQILSQRRGCKHMYITLLQKSSCGFTNIWEGAWEREMGYIDWKEVYMLNRRTSASIKYKVFQYKILTRIVVTNRLLQSMGLTSSYMCNRCNSHVDTVVHRFWACPIVQLFWTSVDAFLRAKGIQNISILNKKVIICGCFESIGINHIITVGKNMIAKGSFLSINMLLTIVKMDMKTEKSIAFQLGKRRDYEDKWSQVLVIFEQQPYSL